MQPSKIVNAHENGKKKKKSKINMFKAKAYVFAQNIHLKFELWTKHSAW